MWTTFSHLPGLWMLSPAENRKGGWKHSSILISAQGSPAAVCAAPQLGQTPPHSHTLLLGPPGSMLRHILWTGKPFTWALSRMHTSCFKEESHNAAIHRAANGTARDSAKADHCPCALGKVKVPGCLVSQLPLHNMQKLNSLVEA